MTYSSEATEPTTAQSAELSSFWQGPATGLTYVDLFAGCGGLSLGLHAAGWEGLFAVEFDPMAFETLHKNLIAEESPFAAFTRWPDWLPQRPLDINELLTDELKRRSLEGLRGTLDLVAGGPPCQGFSVGGARRVLDPRNTLAASFVEFVRVTEPYAVLLENVEGFDKPFRSPDSPHRQSYADVTKRDLEEAGYTVAKLMLHAVDHGVPQTRRRVILFGLRAQIPEPVLGGAFAALLAHFGEELRASYFPSSEFPITVGEAIDDLWGTPKLPWPERPKFQTLTYGEPRSEYARLMRQHTEGWEIPDCHRVPIHTEPVLRLFDEAQRTQRPGRLPRSFLVAMGTQSRKKFLLDPLRPSSTLTSHPDEFIHHEEPRIITLREAARLQSFPDAFTFHGRYTLNGDRRGLDVSRNAQIGNAIPPLAARSLGLAARAAIEVSQNEVMRIGDQYLVASGKAQLAFEIA